MTTTLAMVPIPGRWRSGIHTSSTTAPTTTVTVPKESAVRRATPWWNTSHGWLPRWASTMSAMLTPYAIRPTRSCAARRTGRSRNRSVANPEPVALPGAAMYANLEAN